MTPKEWYDKTIGKTYDIDGAYGAQCWDYFAKFIKDLKIPCSTYCQLTGYAGDLWRLRSQYGYGKYFDFITNITDLNDGDWCFWPQHVAMYWNGQQLGQNQNGHREVTLKSFNKKNFYGAMRFKGWTAKTGGVAECYSKILAGTYRTTTNVNLRSGGSTEYSIVTLLPKGSRFVCYGYYHMDGTQSWYYGIADGKIGFICSKYLERL